MGKHTNMELLAICDDIKNILLNLTYQNHLQVYKPTVKSNGPREMPDCPASSFVVDNILNKPESFKNINSYEEFLDIVEILIRKFNSYDETTRMETYQKIPSSQISIGLGEKVSSDYVEKWFLMILNK